MTKEKFLVQLRSKAEQKAKEYVELVLELHRLDMQIERTRLYIEQLNNFVQEEGVKNGDCQ